MTHLFMIVWTALPWWALILVAAYIIYFVFRAYAIWDATKSKGLWRGIRDVIFDYDSAFRVYHIVVILFDLPPLIVGLFFPVLRKILTFKIYEFKKENPST